jgi:hypothetical protein
LTNVIIDKSYPYNTKRLTKMNAKSDDKRLTKRTEGSNKLSHIERLN